MASSIQEEVENNANQLALANQRVQQAESERDALRVFLQELEDKYKREFGEHGQTNANISALTNENKALQTRIGELENLCSELEEKYNALYSNHSQLRTSLENAENELQSSRDAVAQFESELESERRAHAELKDSFNRSLVAKDTAVEERLQSRTRRIEELETVVSTLNNDLSKCRFDIESLRAQIVILERSKEEALSQKKELENAMSAVKDDASKKVCEYETLRKRVIDATRRESEAVAEAKLWKEKSLTLEASLFGLQNELQRLRDGRISKAPSRSQSQPRLSDITRSRSSSIVSVPDAESTYASAFNPQQLRFQQGHLALPDMSQLSHISHRNQSFASVSPITGAEYLDDKSLLEPLDDSKTVPAHDPAQMIAGSSTNIPKPHMTYSYSLSDSQSQNATQIEKSHGYSRLLFCKIPQHPHTKTPLPGAGSFLLETCHASSPAEASTVIAHPIGGATLPQRSAAIVMDNSNVTTNSILIDAIYIAPPPPPQMPPNKDPYDTSQLSSYAFPLSLSGASAEIQALVNVVMQGLSKDGLVSLATLPNPAVSIALFKEAAAVVAETVFSSLSAQLDMFSEHHGNTSFPVDMFRPKVTVSFVDAPVASKLTTVRPTVWENVFFPPIRDLFRSRTQDNGVQVRTFHVADIPSYAAGNDARASILTPPVDERMHGTQLNVTAGAEGNASPSVLSVEIQNPQHLSMLLAAAFEVQVRSNSADTQSSLQILNTLAKSNYEPVYPEVLELLTTMARSFSLLTLNIEYPPGFHSFLGDYSKFPVNFSATEKYHTTLTLCQIPPPVQLHSLPSVRKLQKFQYTYLQRLFSNLETVRQHSQLTYQTYSSMLDAMRSNAAHFQSEVNSNPLTKLLSHNVSPNSPHVQFIVLPGEIPNAAIDTDALEFVVPCARNELVATEQSQVQGYNTFSTTPKSLFDTSGSRAAQNVPLSVSSQSHLGHTSGYSLDNPSSVSSVAHQVPESSSRNITLTGMYNRFEQMRNTSVNAGAPQPTTSPNPSDSQAVPSVSPLASSRSVDSLSQTQSGARLSSYGTSTPLRERTYKPRKLSATPSSANKLQQSSTGSPQERDPYVGLGHWENSLRSSSGSTVPKPRSLTHTSSKNSSAVPPSMEDSLPSTGSNYSYTRISPASAHESGSSSGSQHVDQPEFGTKQHLAELAPKSMSPTSHSPTSVYSTQAFQESGVYVSPNSSPVASSHSSKDISQRLLELDMEIERERLAMLEIEEAKKSGTIVATGNSTSYLRQSALLSGKSDSRKKGKEVFAPEKKSSMSMVSTLSASETFALAHPDPDEGISFMKTSNANPTESLQRASSSSDGGDFSRTATPMASDLSSISLTKIQGGTNLSQGRAQETILKPTPQRTAAFAHDMANPGNKAQPSANEAKDSTDAWDPVPAMRTFLATIHSTSDASPLLSSTSFNKLRTIMVQHDRNFHEKELGTLSEAQVANVLCGWLPPSIPQSYIRGFVAELGLQGEPCEYHDFIDALEQLCAGDGLLAK